MIDTPNFFLKASSRRHQKVMSSNFYFFIFCGIFDSTNISHESIKSEFDIGQNDKHGAYFVSRAVKNVRQGKSKDVYLNFSQFANQTYTRIVYFASLSVPLSQITSCTFMKKKNDCTNTHKTKQSKKAIPATITTTKSIGTIFIFCTCSVD